MLSAETLQSYKLMTPAARLRLSLDLSADATKALLSGPPNVVDRRFELLRIQNDQRNYAMLEGIARTRISKP
jgi:hypothetical protein